MEPVTVDMEKLTADLARLEEDEAGAQAVVDDASERLDTIRRRRAQLSDFVDRLRDYAVKADGDLVPPSLPPGQLSQMTGQAASEAFIAMKPGATIKLETIYEEMTSLGYTGTLNSIQVAFANLKRARKVERVKRGTYYFPTDPQSERSDPNVVTHPNSTGHAESRVGQSAGSR